MISRAQRRIMKMCAPGSRRPEAKAISKRAFGDRRNVDRRCSSGADLGRNRPLKGSGLLEFALGFSVLTVLFVGMAQLAYTMVVLNQLSSAVRAGARYASMAPVNDPEQLTREIRNVVAYGTPEPTETSTASAPGLRPGHVKVDWTTDAAGIPESVVVTLERYTVPVLFDERELNGRPSARARRLGRWSVASAVDAR